MKKLFVLLTMVSLNLIGAQAPKPMEPPKLNVGYVDLQRALEQVNLGKAAKMTLEKDISAKRAELKRLQEAIEKETNDLEKNTKLKTPERASKRAELQKRFLEFQKNASESQTLLEKREKDLTKPIIDELKNLVTSIGKEKKFNIILEKSEAAVLYFDIGSDITSSVIERFNLVHAPKIKS